LLLASCTFAAATGKGTLHLYDTVQVQGKQLAPGDYKLQWNGEGPKVELTISSGKETIVSVPAEVVTVADKSRTDGYTASKANDGSSALTEISFGGKTYELRLGNPSNGGASSTGATGSSQ
jgi:hypothetical protein